MMVVTVAGRPLPLDPRLAWRAIRTDVAAMPRALKAWLVFLLLLMGVGAVGAVRALFPGDKGIATTPTVEWGLLIVGYVFFAITTSGLCLASSLGTVFGIDRFRPLEKRHAVLAVLCLVTAFGVIALDLHFPIRLLFGAVLNPSPASPMWWMGVFYGAYLVSLLVELWSIFWHHPSIHQWSCLVSSIIAIFAPLTLGAVFAVVASRALWSGLFTPLHMIAAAYVSGVALLAIVFYLVGRLRLVGRERAVIVAQPAIRLLLGLGLVVLALLVTRQLWVGTTTSDAGLRSATDVLLTGPLALEYIGLRVVAGLAVPLLLMLVPQTRTSLGLVVAAMLTMIGVFVDRLTFVEAGQLAPVTTVGGVVSAPYAAYAPSLVEIAIVVGGVALIAFAYTLAERYLDLSESEAHPTIGVVTWAIAGFVSAGRGARQVVAKMPRITLRRPPKTADGAQTADSTDSAESSDEPESTD
ncbi:MAG: NrfD/PsrC family molybdoenzyme membrane anchor subunit [Candidatus Limnocylindrales bacterium]